MTTRFVAFGRSNVVEIDGFFNATATTDGVINPADYIQDFGDGGLDNIGRPGAVTGAG